MIAPTEWQCACGAWVPVGYGRHPHVKVKPASIGAMRGYRAMIEAGLVGSADPTDNDAEITYAWRTAESPVR